MRGSTMIKMVREEEPDAITHCGTMHADEVFATAFLELYYGEIKVARVKEVDKNLKKETLVYDIGRGKYDHHQENAEVRENGIKYSSFGLLWKDFGIKYLEKLKIKEKEEVFLALDQDFVMMIDAIDNGIFPKIEASYKVKTVSDVIKLFNPSFGTNEKENDQFALAVSVAKTIWKREIRQVVGKIKAKHLVLKEIKEQKGPILFLKEYMPYEQTLLESSFGEKFLLVVFPSNRGGYSVQCIPISTEIKEDRILFPEEWAGLDQKALQEVSKTKTIRFCHRNRFIACCDTKEDAIAIAKKAIEIAEEKEKNG